MSETLMDWMLGGVPDGAVEGTYRTVVVIKIAGEWRFEIGDS